MHGNAAGVPPEFTSVPCMSDGLTSTPTERWIPVFARMTARRITYFFQKIGTSRTTTVNISSLPAIIQKIRTHFPAAGIPW